MISDQDRSYYIGASDTKYVMGNKKTATFEKWWRQKLGLNKDHFTNEAMLVGTHLEHKILDTIPYVVKDMQIIIPELRLRVNYDGVVVDHIYEVKTHKNEFKVTKPYWQQAQVEMFALSMKLGRPVQLDIVAYQVDEEDYKNFFAPIDLERLKFYPIEYDPKFIEEYKGEMSYLVPALEEGRMPCQ